MKIFLLLSFSILQAFVFSQNQTLTQDNVTPVINGYVYEVDVRNVDAGLSYYTQLDNSWNITATDDVTSSDKLVYGYSLFGATNGNVSTLRNQRFNKGTTVVTALVMDEAGNKSSKIFQIVILDQLSNLTECPNSLVENVKTNIGKSYKVTGTRWNPDTPRNGILDCSYTLFGASKGYGTNLNQQILETGQTKVLWVITDNQGKQSACLLEFNVAEK